MSREQPPHDGPNYQGRIDSETAFQLARQQAMEMTPAELLEARLVRLAREAADLTVLLTGMRKSVDVTANNEENVRIVESEFAFARRAIERMTIKVAP